MSSISATSSSTDLTSLLRASGLSLKAAEVVQDDVDQLQPTISTSSSTAQTLDSESFRRALSARIDSDVSNGDLTDEEAKAVKQTLGLEEQITTGSSDETSDDGSSGSSTVSSGQSAAPAGGGGGGGGGGEEQKTEVSRTETIAKGVKTTIIVYDDGTTETQTSFTTDPDTRPANEEEGRDFSKRTESYLSSIDPGTLFSVYA